MSHIKQKMIKDRWSNNKKMLLVTNINSLMSTISKYCLFNNALFLVLLVMLCSKNLFSSFLTTSKTLHFKTHQTFSGQPKDKFSTLCCYCYLNSFVSKLFKSWNPILKVMRIKISCNTPLNLLVFSNNGVTETEEIKFSKATNYLKLIKIWKCHNNIKKRIAAK